MRILARKTRLTVHKHRVWLAPAYLLWEGFLAQLASFQSLLVKSYAFALFTLGLYLYLYYDGGW